MLNPDDIILAVATYYRIGTTDLIGRRQTRCLPEARSVAVYLMRQETLLSYPEIAMKLGRSAHSTVIDAERRINRSLRNSPLMAERIGQISDMAAAEAQGA